MRQLHFYFRYDGNTRTHHPDGTVNVMARLLNKNIGTVKVCYDILMAIASVILLFTWRERVWSRNYSSAIVIEKMLTLMKKILNWKFKK